MTSLENQLAQNEALFREFNESVEQGLQRLKQTAEEENWRDEVYPDDKLHFYCECSDENCHERVILKPSTYISIHKNRNKFVVVCGHEVPEVEIVVKKTSEYCVIRKHKTPPESADYFRQTPVSNQ